VLGWEPRASRVLAALPLSHPQLRKRCGNAHRVEPQKKVIPMDYISVVADI
jgi:hypothetical protein